MYDENITKLENEAPDSWNQFERAVLRKDVVAARAYANGNITKLEKKIADSWGRLERAVQSKDIVATGAALEALSQLDTLRQQHSALEKSIAESLGNVPNGAASQTVVPEIVAKDSLAQAVRVPESAFTGSNGSGVQTAPVAESISNGAPIQSAPVPVPGKAVEVPQPQPEVQSPARPKKKPVRPVELKFGSVKKHIRYATEIPVAIANWLIEQGKELPTSENFIHPSEAGFSQSAVTKKLKSGQVMRVGHNQQSLLHKSRELLDGCGYEGVQIKVLLDNGITLSA
jgi:hypothetical protein